MKFHNYEEVPDYKVEEWLRKSMDLTEYQKQKMYQEEIVRRAPFKFYQLRSKTKKLWIRFTIIVLPLVWLLIFISLPFNFIITGIWGYKYERIKWFYNWTKAIGL